MATTAWTGTVSDNWGTAANWTNGVPGSDDIAIISPDAVRHIKSGLTPGVTDLGLLYIAEGSNIEIGDAGNPLTLDADKVLHKGNGTLHYAVKSDTVVTQRHCINAPSTTKFYLSGENADIVEVVSGHMILTALGVGGGAVDELRIGSNFSTLSNPRVTANPLVGNITMCAMSGGVLELSAGVPTFFMSGGYVKHVGHDTVVGALYQSGGLYELYPSNVGGAAVSNLRLMGGVFDATVNDLPKTITAYTLWPGGELRVNPDIATKSELILAG